jgi:hypothetical protein
MSDVLARICDGKRVEIARAKAAHPMREIEHAAREASPASSAPISIRRVSRRPMPKAARLAFRS